jgi:transcriptional regulator with XRE-family HTH domain
LAEWSNAPHSKCGWGEISSQVQILYPPLSYGVKKLLYRKRYRRFESSHFRRAEKFSKLADISLNTVVKLELDKSPNPTLETIQKISKALDITLNELTK